MNTILKEVLRKEAKINVNTESDTRRMSDLGPNKLISRQNTAPLPDFPLIQYPFLLLVCFLEPTFYLIDYVLFGNFYKLASASVGYLSFIYLLCLYIFSRDQYPIIKKRERFLLCIGIIASIITSFIHLHPDKQYNLLTFLPVLVIKVYFIIQIPFPVILIVILVGLITAYGITLSVLFAPSFAVVNYVQSGTFFGLLLIAIFYYKDKKEKYEHKTEGGVEDMKIQEILKAFDVLEEGVVLIESGCLVYCNQTFKKMFRDSSNGVSQSSMESLEEKEMNFLIRKFNRVKNVKARNVILQSQLKDILRHDVILTQRVSFFYMRISFFSRIKAIRKMRQDISTRRIFFSIQSQRQVY